MNGLTRMVAAAAGVFLAACAAAEGDRAASTSSAILEGTDPLLALVEPSGGEDSAASSYGNCKFPSRGERLFKCETFGGNGRTCSTCHRDATGTFSPAEAQALYARDRRDPLFRPIDSDLGLGLTYARLLDDAVVRVTVDLPPNVTIAEMPTARSVVLNRSVPTTINTPALDPVLMWDGRAPTLEAQALGAIHGHAEGTIEPTASQLSAIAKYEKTLFSSDVLRAFAAGGAAPELPPGNTDAEKRGRVAFVKGPNGKCAFCHDGAMLDQTNEFNIDKSSPIGSRFGVAFVSELNDAHNPVLTYLFTKPDGTVAQVQSADPGRALITGNSADGFPAQFKIPTLWGVSKTAPYFHDGSAKTLEDVGAHYQKFFDVLAVRFQTPSVIISDQERDDIVAYLKLL